MKQDLADYHRIVAIFDEYYQKNLSASIKPSQFIIDNEFIRIILNQDQRESDGITLDDYASQIFKKIVDKFPKEVNERKTSHNDIRRYIKNIKSSPEKRENWKQRTVIPSTIALFELLFKEIDLSNENRHRRSLIKIISHKGEKPLSEAKAILISFCDKIKQELQFLNDVHDIRNFLTKLQFYLDRVNFAQATSLLNRMVFQLEKELPKDFFDFHIESLEELDIDEVEKENLYQKCLDYRNALSILTDAFHVANEDLNKLRKTSREAIFERFLEDLFIKNKQEFYLSLMNNYKLIKIIKEQELNLFFSHTNEPPYNYVKQIYDNSRIFLSAFQRYLEKQKVEFEHIDKIGSVEEMTLSEIENYEYQGTEEGLSDSSKRVEFILPGIKYNNKELIKTTIRERPNYFIFTERFFTEKENELKKEGFPKEITSKLKDLIGHSFKDKNEALETVKKILEENKEAIKKTLEKNKIEHLENHISKEKKPQAWNEFYLGIDLGTSNSLLAYTTSSLTSTRKDIIQPQLLEIYKPKSEEDRSESYLLPSWVYYSASGKIFKVGKEVKNELWYSPKEKKQCIRSFKKEMGTNQTIHELTPAELSSQILIYLKKKAEEALNRDLRNSKVVVTVPAAFEESARLDTVDAIKLAGFSFEHDDYFPLLDESKAICYAYLSYLLSKRKIYIGGSPKTCLIYDHGGGTLNVTLHRFSVAEGNIIHLEDIAISRLNHLGGEYFDSRIAEKLNAGFFLQPSNKELEYLYDLALDEFKVWGEDIKIWFSKNFNSSDLFEKNYSKDIYVLRDCAHEIIMKFAQYKEIISSVIIPDSNVDIFNYRNFIDKPIYKQQDNIISPIIQCLVGAEEKTYWNEISKNGNIQIDYLILNGGMTKETHIRNRLEDFFKLNSANNKIELFYPQNPEQTVAFGASIYNYFAWRQLSKLTVARTERKDLEVELPIIPQIESQNENDQKAIISDQLVDTNQITETISIVYIDNIGKIALDEIFETGTPFKTKLEVTKTISNITFKDRMVLIPFVRGKGKKSIELNEHFSTVFFPVKTIIKEDVSYSVNIKCSLGRNRIIDFECKLLEGGHEIEELKEKIRVKDDFKITLDKTLLRNQIFNNLNNLAKVRNFLIKKEVINKLQVNKMYLYLSDEKKRSYVIYEMIHEIKRLQNEIQNHIVVEYNIKNYLSNLKKLELFHDFLLSLNIESPYAPENIKYSWTKFKKTFNEYKGYVTRILTPVENSIVSKQLLPELKQKRCELAGCFKESNESELTGKNILKYSKEIFNLKINDTQKIYLLEQMILVIGEIGLNTSVSSSLRSAFANFLITSFDHIKGFTEGGKLRSLRNVIIESLGKLAYCDNNVEKFLETVINSGRDQEELSILVICRKIEISKKFTLVNLLPFCKKILTTEKKDKKQGNLINHLRHNVLLTLSYVLSREKGIAITINEIISIFDIFKYSIKTVAEQKEPLQFRKAILHLLAELGDRRNTRKLSSNYIIDKNQCNYLLDTLEKLKNKYKEIESDFDFTISMIRAEYFDSEISGRLIEIRKKWDTGEEEDELIRRDRSKTKLNIKLSLLVTRTLSVGSIAWIAHQYPNRYTSATTGCKFFEDDYNYFQGYNESVKLLSKVYKEIQSIINVTEEFTYRNKDDGFSLAKIFNDSIKECQLPPIQGIKDIKSRCNYLSDSISRFRSSNYYRLNIPIYEIIRSRFNEVKEYLYQQKNDTLKQSLSKQLLIQLDQNLLVPSTFFPVEIILKKILKNEYLGGELIKYQQNASRIVVKHFLINISKDYDGYFIYTDYILSYWVQGCRPFASTKKNYEMVFSNLEQCDFIEKLYKRGFYLWGDFYICSVNPNNKKIYIFDTETGKHIDKNIKALYEKNGIIPSEYYEDYGVNYLFSFSFVSDPNESPIKRGSL